MIATIVSVLATLFAFHVAWSFLKEYRVRSANSRGQGIDSLLLALSIIAAAALLWIDPDAVPWLPRTVLILTGIATIVSLAFMRRIYRAEQAKRNQSG